MTSPAIIQKELLDAKAVLVGSGNYNNAMAGSIAAFLEKLITCKVKNKKGLGFGSYGWGGTWLEDWGTRIKDAGGELVADGVAILGEPDDDGKAQCEELGKTLANA